MSANLYTSLRVPPLCLPPFQDFPSSFLATLNTILPYLKPVLQLPGLRKIHISMNLTQWDLPIIKSYPVPTCFCLLFSAFKQIFFSFLSSSICRRVNMIKVPLTLPAQELCLVNSAVYYVQSFYLWIRKLRCYFCFEKLKRRVSKNSWVGTVSYRLVIWSTNIVNNKICN